MDHRATHDTTAPDTTHDTRGTTRGTTDTGLGHLLELDGLRGLAIALVVAFHAGLPGFRGGGLGVVVFFTLSGFLITTLLAQEFRSTGRFDVGRFYARRALRLFPALLALVLVCAVAVVALPPGATRTTLLHETGWAAVYGTNWHLTTLPEFPAGSFLGHTWSLSVEEQFYLAWPVLLLVLLRARWQRTVTVAVVVAAALAAAGWRAVLSANGHTGHAAYGLDTNAVGLLLGAALALGLAGSTRRTAPRAAGTVLVVAAGALALVTVVGTEGPLAHGLAEVVAAAATVGLIWGVRTSPGLGIAAVLRWRPLTWLGVISYSLYLWHFPVFAVVNSDRLDRSPVVLLVAKLGLSVVAAVASHRYVEKPFLRLKSRLPARAPRPVAATTSVADATGRTG